MKRVSLPWLAVLVVPLVNVFAYAWLEVTTVVSRDQWRFLPMVQDWYEGHFHWASLWLSHSQHRIPVYKLLFLLNAVLLQLDMRFEVMLGAALLGLAVMLLVKRFLEDVPANVPMQQRLLAAAAFTWLGLSLNQWDSLIYGLGALNGFGHLAAFTVFWLWLDATLRQGASGQTGAGLVALLAFILLCCAGGHGPAFLAAMFAVVAVAWYRSRPDEIKNSSRLLAALALAALAAELVYWFAGPLAPVKGGATLSQALAAPWRVPEYLLMSLASSALPVAGMEHHGWPRSLSLLLGAVIALVYVWAIAVFTRRRLWSVTYVPAFLMTYSLLVMASVFLVRFGEGLDTAAAPRYVLDNQLGLLGCFWTLVLWRSGGPQTSGAAWQRWVSVPTLSGAVLLTALAASLLLWRHSGDQRRMVAAAEQQVRAGDFEAQDWICPDVALCRAGAEFMKRERLNVFRDGPEAGH